MQPDLSLLIGNHRLALSFSFQVENYVAHIRMLTEARDSLATAFERENAQLRVEVTQLQLEQGTLSPPHFAECVRSSTVKLRPPLKSVPSASPLLSRILIKLESGA